MMKPEEIIEGLKYTVAMCEYDSLTGDIIERCFMNEMTRTTYDACKAAIEFIEKHQYVHDKCKKCIEFSEFKKQPCEDVVSIGVFEQVKWERDIAIEQLNQLGYSLGEKINTDGDCISREQTLKAFAEKCGGECACCKYNGSGYDTAENCKLIKSMPSVTPSRPRGKWIQTKDDCDGVNFYDFSFECSKCGKEQSFKSNYCPNCGAYMRGEDNDNK